jgi:PAS domain S-box-containing protein
MKQVLRPAEELFVTCPEFKLLADAMPQIVWLADAQGVTYYYNAKWYEYIGDEEGHDKEPYFYSDVLHPDDSAHAQSVWQECVREAREFKIEYRFIDKKNGGHRWYLGRALPVKDNDGIVTWYGTYTDINEQKEAIQFRDDFLSIAGHELKTPLTTLRM